MSRVFPRAALVRRMSRTHPWPCGFVFLPLSIPNIFFTFLTFFTFVLFSSPLFLSNFLRGATSATILSRIEISHNGGTLARALTVQSGFDLL